MEIILLFVGLVAGLAAGAFFIYIYFLPKIEKRAKDSVEEKLKISKNDAESIRKSAVDEAEHIKKKAILDGKEEVHKLREAYEKEMKKDKEELKQYEDRLAKREETIERKEQSIEDRKKYLDEEINKVQELKENAEKKLYELADINQEQAKEIVLTRAKETYEYDVAQRYRIIKEQYEEDANKHAKWVIANAIQRYSAEYTGELTVSTVSLPADEMKGRIIGREGRNIRAFEKMTGADLIIDDTPEVVVISCFNPLRRVIAKLSLEKLVEDGRIHPARIEEMYEKTKKELFYEIKEAGQEALIKVGIASMHPELVKLLGRLKYRTSYGQNVLAHSIEVAQIGAIMAAELNLNVNKVKRGALLHDIGKAVDHEIEGSHADIGADIAKRYGEKPEVVNMIKFHHGESEPITPEAVLVAAADAVSAARPGARRESLDMYIKRLEDLENIAKSFLHIEKAYAIQAGREVRVIVEPDKVDDVLSDKIAADISKKIEDEMEYPGVIKVTVIREKRSVSYAN